MRAGGTLTASPCRMSVSTFRDAWLIPTLSKLLDATQLEEVQGGESCWQVAVDKGYTTDAAVLSALAARFRMPLANLENVSAAAIAAINESLARRYQFVPLGVSDAAIEIATANPNDLDCERAVGFATGKSVRMHLAAPSAIATRLDEYYRPEVSIESLLDATGANGALEMLDEAALEDAGFDLGAEKAATRPIIRLVDHIISEGISHRASDIHLEPQDSGLQVTYRIDGVLRPMMRIPRAAATPLVSRIKIMSGLDIADRLRPQDGRARVSVDGKRVDLRISTLPASMGEKVVVRILDSNNTVLQLESLGARAADLERVNHLINLREGIILVTGPTGSGKTTTLYSALKTIQTRGVNIVTVEDPVEYKLNGIVQVQVNEKAGLTFAAALRSILRQDPDVVLVGEIRDRETAGIAIQASLTGHLVLSTLHTIDASSSVARLLDIGIEPYKIGAALKGVIAQRLVRRLCSACREPVSTDVPARLARWLPPGALLFKPKGCSECGQSGYRGRLALMEVLVTTAEVERRISSGESVERIAEAGREAGMQGLWEAGIDHVLEGNTDLDELVRVIEVPTQRAIPQAHPKQPPRGPARVRSGGQRAVSEPPKRPAAFGGDAFELSDALVPVGGPGGGQQRVLVVDDESPFRRAIRDVLEREGFLVAEAEDGVAALEEIDHVEPDLVLLDLNIPRLDGFGVLGRLRSRLATANLPVIVLTAVGDEETEVRVFDAGASDFVTKPFRPRALVARIRGLVRAK